MNAPRFAIVIPVLDDAAWLPGSIDSVLAQDYADWQLVIGDNASAEDIAGIAGRYEDPRILYHRWRTRAGLHQNFNRTCALAGAEWVLPLGADDRLDARCLSVMAESLAAAPAGRRPLALILAPCRRVTADGRPADVEYYGTHRPLPVAGGLYGAEEWLRLTVQPGDPPWNIGSLAVAQWMLRESGGLFRPELGLCADNELVMRAAAYGDVLYINEAIMSYTVRADSDMAARFERSLERGYQQTPHGLACLAGLQAHEAARTVSAHERALVHAAVARFYIMRAGAQRFRPGGLGPWGALLDVLRAVRFSPGAVCRPDQLTRAAAAVLAPGPVLKWARRAAGRRLHGAPAASSSTAS